MGKTLVEVRKEERKPVRVFINYRTIDQFFSEIGTNLSLGGVFVKSTNPLPVGTEIKISFNIPQFGCYLESLGVVVHNGTAENPGMGIKFKNLSERAKKLLSDVLEHELLTPRDSDERDKKQKKKKNAGVTVTVESKLASGMQRKVKRRKKKTGKKIRKQKRKRSS
ncbi:MAG: PilZ domain-containing protein [Deltaproteobacteria bacterium]|nr:PilZ domain-containing protein [Deltaproteobacteria bacterium]